MKKGILLSAFLCCILGASAQTSIEFIPIGGYTFADKLNFNSTLSAG